MSRESKIFTPTTHNIQETITRYEAFGWELLSLDGSRITMSRETQNPVYTELVKHQAKYEELDREYHSFRHPKQPSKPESSCFTYVMLYLLFIVPGVLYTAYKIRENDKYEEALEAYNAELERIKNRKDEILKEMEQIALDSRAIFFSRQSN